MAENALVRATLSRRGLLAGSAALLVSARSAFGQVAAGADLTRITERGELRIAMPAFASLPFFSEAGQREAGLDADLARGIAAALQIDAAFDRSAATFDDAVAQVATGATDMALCKLSRTLTRGRAIRYSRPYARLHHGLITNRVRFARLADGRPAEEVIRGFAGDLGVIAHSSFAEFARDSFPAARVHEFGDWPTMIEAIRAEAIDVAYRDDFEIKKLMVDDPSLTVVARSIALTDKTDTLAVGIRPDAPHLASFVDLFLDLARGGAMMTTDEIIALYRAGSSA